MADEKKTIFTLTVYGAAHETMASELAHIDRACTQASQAARSAGGGKLNGIMLGDSAVELGEWEYSPVASD
jgi:hypothetical protein